MSPLTMLIWDDELLPTTLNPCSDGSREYVTFWADFDDNGSFETCLGTAEVQVYDVDDIPPEGIHYAVRLPVDLSAYRQHCKKGPKVVRIRAILSWNDPVPCGNPNKVPIWGNREETLINIAPPSGQPAGKIAIIGNIPVERIDPVTGLTTSAAYFTDDLLPPDDLGRPCPFGGRVNVKGLSMPGWSYKVEVSQDGSMWIPVVTDLKVVHADASTHDQIADPVTKRFAYLPFDQNVENLLAIWITHGDARWLVKLTVYDPAGVKQGTDVRVIQLDNTRPEVSITITTGPGNCGRFPEGTLLEGKFVARDKYLREFDLYVAPTDVNVAPIGVPSPTHGTVGTAPAPGDDWKLKTKDMVSCGYTIHVRAIDRAIVNNQRNGIWRYDSAGFCLIEPEEEGK